MARGQNLVLVLVGVAIGAVVFSPVGVATPFTNETVNNSVVPFNGSQIGNASVNVSLSSEPNKTAARQSLHDRTNEKRANQGLSELEYSDELEMVAQYYAERMANQSFFSHTAPDGESVEDRYQRFGIACRAPGENIFTADPGPNAADEIATETVESWMTSPQHRKNILRNQWFAQGFGVAESDDGTLYVVQNFC